MTTSDRLYQLEREAIEENEHLMLAALRAVLAIDTGDNRNVYGIDFEAGMVKALWIVHQTIATALGEEQ